MGVRSRTAERAGCVATGIALLALLVVFGRPDTSSAALHSVLELHSESPIKIPNGSGAARMTFNATQQTGNAVGGIVVDVRVRHEQTHQLEVYVKGPSGPAVALVSHETRGADYGSGQCQSDHPSETLFTRFYDGASSAISTGTQPYTGGWLPHDSLAGFATASIAGTWSIIVKDTHPSGHSGTLKCGMIEIPLS
jgi:subtilisin-like proprotein convertase family protein